MKTLAAALLALLTFQDKALFEEKFEGKLSEGWSWLREDAAGWKLEGGALRIKTQPGTLFYKSNNAKNVLLRKPPAAGTEAAPVAFEATVESAPAKDAEQVGLLFYVDEDNYVKLVREFLKGKTNVVMAREAKRIFENLPAKEEAAARYRLRLVWAGPKVSGFINIDGDKGWTPVGTYDVPPGENPQFGLCAHGAAADADRWASITGLRILSISK